MGELDLQPPALGDVAGDADERPHPPSLADGVDVHLHGYDAAVLGHHLQLIGGGRRLAPYMAAVHLPRPLQLLPRQDERNVLAQHLFWPEPETGHEAAVGEDDALLAVEHPHCVPQAVEDGLEPLPLPRHLLLLTALGGHIQEEGQPAAVASPGPPKQHGHPPAVGRQQVSLLRPARTGPAVARRQVEVSEWPAGHLGAAAPQAGRQRGRAVAHCGIVALSMQKGAHQGTAPQQRPDEGPRLVPAAGGRAGPRAHAPACWGPWPGIGGPRQAPDPRLLVASI
ncbi:hypothetical protein HRbin24_01907 [bacterium HR24]|nr:hypothetical protein HRbin24_01907 [bacterium HR24]